MTQRLSALLCDATSPSEKVCDMMCGTKGGGRNRDTTRPTENGESEQSPQSNDGARYRSETSGTVYID